MHVETCVSTIDIRLCLAFSLAASVRQTQSPTNCHPITVQRPGRFSLSNDSYPEHLESGNGCLPNPTSNPQSFKDDTSQFCHTFFLAPELWPSSLVLRYKK